MRRNTRNWAIDLGGEQPARRRPVRLVGHSPSSLVVGEGEEQILQRRSLDDEPVELVAAIERPAGERVQRRRRSTASSTTTSSACRRDGRRRRASAAMSAGSTPAGSRNRTVVSPDRRGRVRPAGPRRSGDRGAARRPGRRGARPRRGSATSAARSCRRRTVDRISSHAPRRAAGSNPVVGSSRNSRSGIADDAEGEVEAAALATGEAVAALVDGVLEPDQRDALLDRPRSSVARRRTARAPHPPSARARCRRTAGRCRCGRGMIDRDRPDRSRARRPTLRSASGIPRGSLPSSSCPPRSRRAGRRPRRGWTVNDTPSTAGVAPYRLTRPATSTTGAALTAMFLNDGEVIGRPVSLRRCSAVGRK